MAERKAAAKAAPKSEESDAGVIETPAPAEPKTAAAKPPRTRVVEVGGHRMVTDVAPPTPEPITICGVCGDRSGECVHMDPNHGRGWVLADEEAKPHATEAPTHGADETRRSGLEVED